MAYSHPAVTLSIRVPPEIRDQLSELSDATGRTKSFLAAEAIEAYLLTQAWQIKSIKKAIKKANSKNANFVDHHKVVDWVNSWDHDDEQEIPVK
ncbi:MAG: ribbon-helix-helix protein, CopG family [Legionellales bacterium]|nr:ribbon-helix-helix protein, CopG family [Legionellales bacterium]